VVEHGAFKKSLEQHRLNNTLPAMFYAHDPAKVPGKWLDIREDARGLRVHGVLPTRRSEMKSANCCGSRLSPGYRLVSA